MTWLAARLFCEEQNSNLVSLANLSRIAMISSTSISGRCWLDDRKDFAPVDLLEGWQWLDGRPYNANGRWGVTGRLQDNGVARRCATTNPQLRFWEGIACTEPHYFICRKKVCNDIILCIVAIRSAIATS
jgi:hypothetical protein